MEYIIWNPTGSTPPKVRFETRQRAQQEAERMAKKHPGQAFYVCALVSVSQINAVRTQQLDAAESGYATEARFHPFSPSHFHPGADFPINPLGRK